MPYTRRVFCPIGIALSLSPFANAETKPRYRLFACGAASKGYVVGMKLPPSGLFHLENGGWQQLGFNHPYVLRLDYDRRNPQTVFLAAGNGCIRSNDGGRHWRILTSWDMTELQDLAVDPHHPGTVFLGLPDGIARTNDEGRTWRRIQSGLQRKYTKSIEVDRARPGHLIAGTESGIFRTTNAGDRWQPVCTGARNVTHIQQSRHDPKHWLATTQQDGLWRSDDGAVSWQNVPAIKPGETLYKISYDPTTPGRIAVGGWNHGVRVSSDNGNTFVARNNALPTPHIWSLQFDPAHRGRLYAGAHEAGAFFSDDAGEHWKPVGLDGAIVFSFAFVPEVPA